MDKDKIFAFYEKAYFRDLDDTNTIITRFPVLIASVALIINAYIFLFKFDEFINLPKELISAVIALVAIFIGRLLYCILRAFNTQDYERVSSLRDLEQYRKDVVQYEKNIARYNEEYPENLQKEVDWQDLFRENLENKFIESSEVNFTRNAIRRKWFHSSMRWVWINLCLCITIPIFTIVIKLWI